VSDLEASVVGLPMPKLVCSAREDRMWQFMHFSASWLRAAYITDVNVESRLNCSCFISLRPERTEGKLRSSLFPLMEITVGPTGKMCGLHMKAVMLALM
jgi:hypothetical protein